MYGRVTGIVKPPGVGENRVYPIDEEDDAEGEEGSTGGDDGSEDDGKRGGAN
ncbi:hypothetical protein BN903_47 [Halorubrum sp. AJ67]|nr:hypothetical protein BN903_47 [Halorubrum sp. AJ67]